VSPQQAIFITGAAAGIGAETARLFAGRGWRVGACDVDEPGLAALERELGADRVSTFVADVTHFDAVEAALGAFVAGAGDRLDAVFANAGVLFMGPNETIGRRQKDRLVDVNVRGLMHAFDAAFPYLAHTPGSCAIAMSSTSAEYGLPQHAVYSATKFFVRGLTEALDIEYRKHGVRVAGVYVPYVQTAMVYDAAVKPATVERLGVRIPPRRVAETVWRAVHGRRVHWRVGLEAKLIGLVARLLGARIAPIYGWLTRE